MFAQVKTLAFSGLEAVPVTVQVHVLSGQIAFNIVGLADKAVAESRERVRSALAAIGMGLPPKRIVVNLSPADLPKEGSHYDLPVALGVMVALGAVKQEVLENYIAMGELGLDGTLAGVPGVLPAAIAALKSGQGLICPAVCGGEAAWSGLGQGDAGPLAAAENLQQLIHHLNDERLIGLPAPERAKTDTKTPPPDLRDIRGQPQARAALEVAAAGGHNLLMSGPPGAGKSMLAQRLPSILPALTPQERLAISMLASLAACQGATPQTTPMATARPFRSPHHSASMPALVGGGKHAKPGEISLAHLGVLFLDELPEFARPVLDALRQPLETGEIEVARVQAHITYPARFQLVAAMNPCRCGHAYDPALACARLPHCTQDYMARLSGPLLDRFDIRIEVPPVKLQTMMEPPSGEDSATVRARVIAARRIQAQRNGMVDDLPLLNNYLDGEDLMRHAMPDQKGRALLDQVVNQDNLSARGFNRVLRVARTLADLQARAQATEEDIATALAWRGVMFVAKARAPRPRGAPIPTIRAPSLHLNGARAVSPAPAPSTAPSTARSN